MFSSEMKRKGGETRESGETAHSYLPGVTGLQNRFSCRSATRQAPICAESHLAPTGEPQPERSQRPKSGLQTVQAVITLMPEVKQKSGTVERTRVIYET
jgi:hypothetical protein